MKDRLSTQEGKIPQTGEEQTAQTQGNELVLRIPENARLPEGGSFYEGEDDGHCRVIKPDGTRCPARRMKSTGLCPGHSGTGIAADPAAHSPLGHAEQKRRARVRATLGISARRAAQPLQQARIAAQMRAQDYAEAVVNAPLDDPELGSVARQQAAIRALELLYPQATLQATVELPVEADEVAGMGWQEMQRLAAQLSSPE